MNHARSMLTALAFLLATTWAAGAAQRPIEAVSYFAAISVADAEASAAWYERVFGLPAVGSTDLEDRGIRIRLLRSEQGFLELIESSQARSLAEIDASFERRYLAHGVFKLGFLVADLDATIERLNALGVSLRGAVVTEDDGSLRSVQIEDPDGNVLQLFERLVDDRHVDAPPNE